MERLTEKRDGKNVIALRQDSKVKWALCSAGMENASTQYLYGEHADKLAEYEDAEEQGLLLRLPLKIGDTVYSVTRDFISEYTICSIEKYNEGLFFNWRCEKGIYINVRGFTNYQIGKDVFLTQAEAEQKLKEDKEIQEGDAVRVVDVRESYTTYVRFFSENNISTDSSKVYVYRKYRRTDTL